MRAIGPQPSLRRVRSFAAGRKILLYPFAVAAGWWEWGPRLGLQRRGGSDGPRSRRTRRADMIRGPVTFYTDGGYGRRCSAGSLVSASEGWGPHPYARLCRPRVPRP